MDAIKALKNKLQAQVAEGETEQALEQLLSLYSKIEGEYLDELILLKSQFKELRGQQLAGIIDRDTAALRSNMIKHALLQIVEELDDDPKVSRHFGLPARKTKSARAGSGISVPSWLWGVLGALGGVALALLAIFFLFPLLNQAETSQPTENPAEMNITTENQKVADKPQENLPIEKPKQAPPRKPKQQPTASTTHPAEEEPVKKEQTEAEPTAPPPVKPKAEKKAGSGESEPNDEMKNAQTISISRPVACYLGASGDVDWFQATISQSGKYVVWMKNADPSLAGVIDVYNERHLRLGRYTNRTPGADHPASFRAQKAGMYYIRVSARGGAGNYTLEVNPE